MEFFWQLELDADAATLWSRLIDTSRLNRALGLASMEFHEEDGVLHGVGSPAGFEHRWVEVPWSWVSGRYVMAERAYERGFSRHARVRYELTPRDGGLSFSAYFGFIPRNWFFRWVLELGMLSLRSRFEAVLRSLAADTAALSPPAASEPWLPPEVERRVIDMAEALRQREVDREGLARLLTLIREGDDMEVHRLQVRRLAHAWRLDERKVLHLFLHATRVGLLELSWDVICPHCRGTREELATLGDVPKRASCAPCEAEFGTDGANAIEITFRIHRSVRSVHKQLFCSAQTAERRHIKVQMVLEPGEARTVEAPLEPGRYRLRRLGDPGFAYLDVGAAAEGADEAPATVRFAASSLPGDARSGGVPRLAFHNDGERRAVFIVEDVSWADEALRPEHLFCYQGFRDLFAEEYIGADVHLAVGEQVILFTDIVGSTKLYLEQGDPQAFSAVRKHFTEVFEVVDAHEGAVVKTIGDATMAVFNDTAQAVEVARVLHERFERSGDDHGPGAIRLRISINTGVCIAVNLNSNIDYFGNTVNLAAKLQRIAGPGEVVLSPSAWAAPGVAALAAERGLAFEPVDFFYEALGETLVARRWSLSKASG